jgi:hypothetical protein
MFLKLSRPGAKTFFGLSLILGGLLVYLGGYPKSVEQSVEAQQPPQCPNCSPDMDRVIYAPTIGLPEADPGKIVLNCRSMHQMDVVPTFYTESGDAIAGDMVHLQPAEIRFVTIDSLIPEADRGQHTWGGMSLSYFGKLMEVWAQITLPGVGERGSSDITFSVLNGAGSDSQEAVWWQPRPGKRVIVLGNSSGTSIHTTAQFADGTTEAMDIAAHATHYIRDNLGGNAPDGPASVKLTTVGPAGSLKANGYIMSTSNSPNNRFASSIRFYEPQTVVQPKLFATNFRAKNSSSHLLLRNTSTTVVTATPVFRPTEGDGEPVTLPSVSINALQSVEVDLQPLLSAAATRTDLESVSVELENDKSPGSLIGALYVKNLSNGVRYDVPLRDSGRLRNSTGAYPWRLDGDYKTTVTVTSVGTESVGLRVLIFYNGGQYTLSPSDLAPGKSVRFDLRRIRDDQVPDQYGHVIPLSATGGQFDWGIINPSDQTRLAGRSEVVSAADNVSSSYSCNYCCPPQGPSYTVPPVSLMEGETANFSVTEWWYNCYGWGFPSQGSIPGLSTVQSTTVSATMLAKGTMQAQGLIAGDAIWGSSEYPYYWSYEGPYDCYSGYDMVTSGGPVVVGPTVTNVTSDSNTYKITSIVGNPNYIHFVTPKGTGAITLTATISPDTQEIRDHIDWEGATKQYKNPLVATLSSRGTAGKTVVKIKYNGHTIKEMRVWVVWATITSADVANVSLPNAPAGNPAGPGFQLTGGYDFTHTIQPSTMITDTDRPDFSGPNLHPAPGGNHPIYGFPLSGGANKKWDNSRQMRFKLLNPNNIGVNDTAFHSFGFPSDVLNYPVSDVEGNDDAGVDGETNDPYSNGGVLTGHDEVLVNVAHRGGMDGNTFEFRPHFLEFTRLEIEGVWFRISDFYPWRFPHAFIRQNGAWVDNGSVKALNNSGF